ncbi:uncharacterized protein LOC143042586 isoform X2 [Mytilus galloprovincialis]|uniref:uncharacterized protein LOC143042586 isoform X2 n=1 Tax=Mytilus galloprovincialis TaxID=29158 RepID=UPI003F7CC5BD
MKMEFNHRLYLLSMLYVLSMLDGSSAQPTDTDWFDYFLKSGTSYAGKKSTSYYWEMIGILIYSIVITFILAFHCCKKKRNYQRM